jgi:8-oxo-dGTP pyrophosphatase MutT (NUDIX family)
MSAAERIVPGWSRPRSPQPPARFIRLAELRRRRGTEQVAAVCYRMKAGLIEFLLVQTRGGRWIFPKGNIEAGLSQAQSAALEAYEEAGVHGRMEELSFTQYTRRKGGDPDDPQAIEVIVNVHLCEVLRLTEPDEPGRNPTWFSINKTKKRLEQNRRTDFAEELTRVVEEAIARIQRIHSRSNSTALTLSRPRFNVLEYKRS